jgi:hypothetical protein
MNLRITRLSSAQAPPDPSPACSEPQVCIHRDRYQCAEIARFSGRNSAPLGAPTDFAPGLTVLMTIRDAGPATAAGVPPGSGCSNAQIPSGITAILTIGGPRAGRVAYPLRYVRP